ncbi:MAG: GAP family protein [Microlunatus sp.]
MTQPAEPEREEVGVLGALGQLLAVGLAAAFSSVPVTVLLVILVSPRRMVAAFPYALGCVAGTLGVVLAAVAAAQLMPEPRPRQSSPTIAVVELVLGTIVFGLGIRAWGRRRRPRHTRKLPNWAATALEGIGPLRAFLIGVIIEFRAKSIVLALVVSLQVHAAANPTLGILVIVIYVVISTVTITVPALTMLMAPQRTEPWLTAATARLATAGPVINAAALCLLGLGLLALGLVAAGVLALP